MTVPEGGIVVTMAHHVDISSTGLAVCGRCKVHGECMILKGLRLPEADRIARSMSQLRFGPGSVIAVHGGAMDHVSIVTQGVVACGKALDDGRRQITGFLFAGDILGHVFEKEHTVAAQAVTEVTLCRFQRSSLEHLAGEHPELGRHLFQKALQELAEAHYHELLLGRTTARERLAAFIVSFVDVMQPNHSPALLLRLPMTRFDIADYLGLTFETVSRTFTGLARDGLISLPTPQEVKVNDVDRLRRIAEGGDGN